MVKVNYRVAQYINLIFLSYLILLFDGEVFSLAAFASPPLTHGNEILLLLFLLTFFPLGFAFKYAKHKFICFCFLFPGMLSAAIAVFVFYSEITKKL